VKPSLGKLTETDSACQWATSVAVQAVYCVSTADGMDIGWLYAPKRKADAVLIGKKGGNTKVKGATPTEGKDKGNPVGGTTLTALSQFHKVELTADNTAAGAFTNAADLDLNATGSACALATAAGTGAENAIFCDSVKASGQKMTLIFLSDADAQADLKKVDALTTGAGNAVVRLAKMKADQFYTAKYAITGFVHATDTTKNHTLVAEDGCTRLMAVATNAAMCEDTTSEVTLTWITAAKRLADAVLLAKADMTTTSKVGTAEISSAKDKAAELTFVTLAYKAVGTAKPHISR